MLNSLIRFCLCLTIAFPPLFAHAAPELRFARNFVLSKKPFLYAKFFLYDTGRLDVVQVDGPDQEIGKRRSLSTKYLKAWERANQSDSEFIEDIFFYNHRLFVLSRPHAIESETPVNAEAAATRATNATTAANVGGAPGNGGTPSETALVKGPPNLHEFTFTLKRTLGARVVVGALAAFSAAWALLPVPLAYAYFRHDPAMAAVIHSTVANVLGGSAYLGVLGASIGSCILALKESRSLRQSSPNTPVRQAEAKMKVLGALRPGYKTPWTGTVFDIYVEGEDGQAVSLKNLIDEGAI